MKLDSRIKRLEKNFAHKISTNNSHSLAFHSNFASLSENSRQPEPCNSDVNLQKNSSRKIVFDSTSSWFLEAGRENVPTPKTDGANFRSHPCGYNIYLNMCPFGSGSAIISSASASFSDSAIGFDFRLPWPLPKMIHLRVRDQMDSLNRWKHVIKPHETQQLTRPSYSGECANIPTIRCACSISHTKRYNRTHGYFCDGNMCTLKHIPSFISQASMPTQPSLYFPFPYGISKSNSFLCQLFR